MSTINYNSGEIKISDANKTITQLVLENKTDLADCNLSNLDLSNLDLSQGYFKYCNFAKSNLTNVKLDNANCKGAFFVKANLTNITVVGIYAGNADFDSKYKWINTYSDNLLYSSTYSPCK